MTDQDPKPTLDPVVAQLIEQNKALSEKVNSLLSQMETEKAQRERDAVVAKINSANPEFKITDDMSMDTLRGIAMAYEASPPAKTDAKTNSSAEEAPAAPKLLRTMGGLVEASKVNSADIAVRQGEPSHEEGGAF